MIYNGYRNFETWDVAQSIFHEWNMIARQCVDYQGLVRWLYRNNIQETSNNTSLEYQDLDIQTLNETIIEAYKCK